MSLLARIYLLGAFTVSIASAQSLFIINPEFGNVPVQCVTNFAYQSSGGGDCTNEASPEQTFNSTPGIGWRFTPHTAITDGSGLTGPETAFNPPSFVGFPFQRAAFLQGSNSIVLQTVDSFVPGVLYALAFYLGSRYESGTVDGNQTVQVLVDGRAIGSWGLVSFTPFTLRAAYFGVTVGGPHVIEFVGLAAGDHTAFVSGVSVRVAADGTR